MDRNVGGGVEQREEGTNKNMAAGVLRSVPPEVKVFDLISQKRKEKGV